MGVHFLVERAEVRPARNKKKLVCLSTICMCSDFEDVRLPNPTAPLFRASPTITIRVTLSLQVLVPHFEEPNRPETHLAQHGQPLYLGMTLHHDR